ncbi:MAG: AAA family ATPase [Campylobacterota bacterium]
MVIDFIISEIEKAVQSKEHNIKLALASFLSGGNILIEDIPGVGKTTLAKTFADVLGLKFKRIQFTSDMLPSDIVGVNYFDSAASRFHFKKGPIFSQCILADEINRTTPKTQSALLEAMEEGQVSVEGVSYKLDENFFVMATQNPLEENGTFALPISQLDRFSISMSIGYPTKEAEKKILTGGEVSGLGSITAKQLDALSAGVKTVYCDDAVIEYILDVADFTRQSGMFEYGLSTRGAKQLLGVAKGWAYVHKRDFVIDADVDAVMPYVLSHRVVAKSDDVEIFDAIRKALHRI